MKSFTADQAKRRFGALLQSAKESPVAIMRHGREAYVVMSKRDFEECEHIRRVIVRQRILRHLEEGVAKFEDGDDTSGEKLIRIANAMMADMNDIWRGV